MFVHRTRWHRIYHCMFLWQYFYTLDRTYVYCWFRQSSFLSNEHCRLVELLQVAKQLLLDCSSVWPDFLSQGCKFQASCLEMSSPMRRSVSGTDLSRSVGLRARFRIKFVIHFMYIDCTYILFKKFKTTHIKLMNSWPIRMTLLGNTISKF
jgi:hypothetical protein